MSKLIETFPRRRTPRLQGRKLCKGFSLIELLISITIGLVIVGAALSAYLSASQSGQVTSAESRMNEDAQAALDFIAQQVRMAGNNPKRPNYTLATPRNPITNTLSVRGCEGTFTNLSSAANVSALTCTSGSASHSLAVTYEADAFNTTPTSTGVPTDCVGISLPAQTASVNQITSATTTAPSNVTFYEADNRFYISTNTSGRPALYCRGNGTGSSAQPLVENIEDMRLTFGTAPATTGNGTVAGYLTSSQIDTDTTVVNLPTALERWGRVTTVRLCVIARTPDPILSDSASAQYTKCDGTLETAPPDLRMRRAYSMTVGLRNRIATP